MASLTDKKMDETICVSSNMFLHIEKDGYGNFYVYDKDDKGFLLNGTTSKDLIRYLLHTEQYELVDEILNNLVNVLQTEVEN